MPFQGIYNFRIDLDEYIDFHLPSTLARSNVKHYVALNGTDFEVCLPEQCFNQDIHPMNETAWKNLLLQSWAQ